VGLFGRADSAAAAGNDTLWMAGEVGTSYGGERDTEDWVCVTRVEVPTATAVPSSVSWFIGARIFYSGFTSHQIERVRRPIVVVNAP
jgi:hypothetical protein